MKSFIGKFEARLDAKFQKFARDPEVLAFIAERLNHASQLRLDFENHKREFASFQSRIQEQIRTRFLQRRPS